MKNITQNCVILLLTLLTPFLSHSQGCTYEIPLTQQVNSSTQIVEGKVISKTSFWNDTETNIYTINRVEVFKTFKGSALSTIEVITEGGAVGLEAQIVTPSLELNLGEIGVFLLYENNIPLESVGSTYPKYKPYSSVQGFYRYDFFENKATNPYHAIAGITSDFYSELTELTGETIEEIQVFSIDEQVGNSHKPQVILIESMSPLTINAGTKSVLTIGGSGFGDEQGKIIWSDVNSGGGNFIYGVDSDVLSWTDTQIEVYVVGRAGTGEVGVEHANGSEREYSGDLEITVPFGHSNIYVNGIMRPMQHIDASGDGGYVWQLSEEFNANTEAKERFIEALEYWRCETGINWTLGSTTSIDDIGSDGVNVVRFGSDYEMEGRAGRSTLSVGQCSSVDDGYVSGLDLTFNRDTDWYFGTDAPGSGQNGFKNAAIHELGHSFILGHVNDESDMMYYGPTGGIYELGDNNLMGVAYVRNKSENIPICSRPLTTPHPDPCGMVTATQDALANFIEIFPNPVKDILYINNKSEAELQQIAVYDAAGHQVLIRDIDKHKLSYEINVNELPQGVYFLELTTAAGTIVEKIVR